jgi:PTS system nitrogen regulatory IIA component
MRLSELVGGQDDVLIGMRADRKRTALSGIAARLAEKVGISHGAVLAGFLRRERLGPTAVGNGIAIPHARLDGIAAPAALLATLKQPVPFGAPDDDSVDLLLALVWPRSDTQGFVPALRGVWRQLQSPELPHLLRQSRTPAAAHAWIQAFEDRFGRRGTGS